MFQPTWLYGGAERTVSDNFRRRPEMSNECPPSREGADLGSMSGFHHHLFIFSCCVACFLCKLWEALICSSALPTRPQRVGTPGNSRRTLPRRGSWGVRSEVGGRSSLGSRLVSRGWVRSGQGTSLEKRDESSEAGKGDGVQEAKKKNPPGKTDGREGSSSRQTTCAHWAGGTQGRFSVRGLGPHTSTVEKEGVRQWLSEGAMSSEWSGTTYLRSHLGTLGQRAL